MINLNFKSYPRLTTERLMLRPLLIGDAQEILFLRSDAVVNRYLDRLKSTSIDEARNFIRKIKNGIASDELIYWAIAFKSETKLIGTICLFNIFAEKSSAEIGFELHPHFHGGGIMQEAITVVLSYGFEKLNLDVITAFSHADNEKSIKLLKRNNFKQDKNFRYSKQPESADLLCFYLMR